MSVSILKKGIADSLQNKGSYGLQHMGVQPGGYMDYLSAHLANYILGNPSHSEVYEIHFPVSHFQFNTNTYICITGAHFVPVINDKSIPMHTPIKVHKGDILQFLQPLQGRIGYIAFNEYFNNEKQGQITQDYKTVVEFIEHQIFDTQAFHFIPGPAWNDLTPDAIHQLLHSSFETTLQSNRMGFQLSGPLLSTLSNKSYLSSAVTRGTMQLLPNGNIIVLMADHQTIGGYPNIGQIILVDLPRLAQTVANSKIHFCISNVQKAHEQYKSIQEKFADRS